MSDQTPKPVAVAQPWKSDAADEPVTGETDAIATTGYVKKKQVAQTTAIVNYVASADLKWFAATMAAVAIASVLLVGWFDARAAEKVAPLEKRIEKVEGDNIERDKHMVRVETILEGLARKADVQVPPPVPPPTKDAGQ